MGGYLAPRSAACDARIKACALSGGSYDRHRLLKRLDDPVITPALHMITTNAARAARLDDYGLAPGRRAELVVIDAPSVHEALRTQMPRRHVVHDGREVARATLSRELRRAGARRRG